MADEAEALGQAPGCFADAVRSRRLAARLTQEGLAAKSGLSTRAVGDIERGQVRYPRPDSARLLADALGLAGGERDGFLSLARASYWADRTDGGPVDGQLARPEPPAAPPRVVPRQLPADVAGFVGRRAHLRELDALLDADRRPPALVLPVISGTAGIGKTTLAVHWAHRLADRFPDGQLYANLHGFDPNGSTVASSDAVKDFLVALGVAREQLPAGAEAQAALYRSLLADRRLLVLLDNARDADQVRPLLPGGSSCLALVTSRDPLVGLVATEGAHPLQLDLLPAAEARELLRHRLGPDRITADSSAVDCIVDRCAGLPLALAITAARALTRPRLPLSATAAELSNARSRLDPLRTDDAATDMRAVFHWSYRLLGQEAARLFRLLGLVPGTDVTDPAAASLLGLPLDRTRPLLAELTRAHLLSEPATGRYTCHDLLRTYAAELTSTVDSAAERRAALHRLLDHYLHTARTAALLLNPNRPLLDVAPPRSGVVLDDLVSHEQAMAWFTAEHAGLLAAVRRADDDGFDLHAARMPALLGTFLDRRGRWDEWAASQTIAVRAAERLGDLRQQAMSCRERGRALVRLGRYDEAGVDLRRALGLFDGLGDLDRLADTQMDLAWLGDLHHHSDGLPLVRKALALYQRSGNRVGQARALNNIGWVHFERGEHEPALTHLMQALSLHREVGNRSGTANTLANVSRIHHQLGRYREALECSEQAVDLYVEAGDRYFQAETLIQVGDSHLAAGDLAGGRRAWEAALAVLDELGHESAGPLRARLSRLTS